MSSDIRIFIVEDSLFLKEMLVYIFKKEGIRVVGTSASVDNSLVQIKKLKPDIVLADIILSQEDGTILISKIQELDLQIKILICSSLSQKNIQIRLPNIKNISFINKPFGYNEIIESVMSVINKDSQLHKEKVS